MNGATVLGTQVFTVSARRERGEVPGLNVEERSWTRRKAPCVRIGSDSPHSLRVLHATACVIVIAPLVAAKEAAPEDCVQCVCTSSLLGQAQCTQSAHASLEHRRCWGVHLVLSCLEE